MSRSRINRNGRRAFSLVQMMVVTAAISLMLGMLLAGVQAVREAANRTLCVHNLHQIGLAYGNYVDRNADPLSFNADYKWVSVLLPYIEKRGDAFYCPNQEVKAFAQEVPQAFIRVNENVFPEYGSTHNIPIATNGTRMRLSPRYVQNDPAGTYYLEMEDWTDWNWCDLTMKYWPSDDGFGFNIQPVGTTGAAFHFDLMAADGVTMLYQNFKPPNYPIVTIPGGSSKSSYAVSAQARYLGTGDSDKVLAVEYNSKVVAKVFGSSPDYWPTYAGVRHRGMLNVLFLNGSVRTMTSADIDPRDSTLYPRHWLPAVPGPLD